MWNTVKLSGLRIHKAENRSSWGREMAGRGEAQEGTIVESGKQPTFKSMIRFCETEQHSGSSLGEGNGRLIHRRFWEYSQRCWSQWGTGMLSWKETGVVIVSGPIKCVGSCNTTGMLMPILTPSKTGGMQSATAKRIPTQQVGDSKVTTESFSWSALAVQRKRQSITT